MRGLSLVVASGGHSSSWCVDLSLSWPLLLQSTGSRRAGSVVVAHGPSCSAAYGIFPDQGSNLCPLLAGRLSTTAPPGKPHYIFIYIFLFLFSFWDFNYVYFRPFDINPQNTEVLFVLFNSFSLCVSF